MRTKGDTLLVGDDTGKVTEVKRSEVVENKPSKQSVMPEKLLEKLTPVLTKRWLSPDAWRIDVYQQLDGYAALRIPGRSPRHSVMSRPGQVRRRW